MAELQEYFITHREVKEANPTWTDRMVDDYLGIKQVVQQVSDIDEARISAIEVRLDALEARLPVSVYTDVNRTTSENELITCFNATPITITLKASPDDQEIVQVKRLDAKVTVDGNGNNIDGDSTITLNRQYTNLAFVYSTSAGEWGIR